MRTKSALLLAIWLVVLSPHAAAVAAQATPAAGDSIYVDPAGQFSAPIPTNWTVEPPVAGLVLLLEVGTLVTSVEGGIGQYVFTPVDDALGTPMASPVALAAD